MAENLVELRDLVKEFPVRGGALQRQVATVRAVSGVDLDIVKGETLGLVGESAASAYAAGALVAELEQLCRDVAVPTPQSYGVDKDDWEARLELMAEQALASGSPGNNPRVPTKDEIVELYREIY